jgi:hypothetical protein
MKDFRDIQEGILGNVDDTLNNTDARLDPMLKEKAREYFNNYTRRNKGTLHLFETANRVKMPEIFKLVDKACYWERDVLVIDFNVFKNPDDYRLYIVYGPDLPMIKVIGHNKQHTTLTTKPFQYATLQISGTKTCGDIDVSKIIHPDTVVSTVQYGAEDYNLPNNIFVDNKFPGTIKDGITYKCMFNKINTKAWPDCTVKFSKDTRNDIFLNAIGMTGKHIDYDMYTGFMVIDD